MNSNEFDREANRQLNDSSLHEGENREETEQPVRTEAAYGTSEMEQIDQAEPTESNSVIDPTDRLERVEQTRQFDRIAVENTSSHPPIDPEGIFADQNGGGHFQLEGLYAGFWMRFWAYLVDLIVIGSVNRMIINPVFRAMDVSLVEDGIFSPVSIATAFVFYLYFVLMTKYYGQTLGKMVFGLKVVELGGHRLSWGTVIFREWIGRFISATVMILYVIVAFSKKKQGLHDMFADTTVIYEPR